MGFDAMTHLFPSLASPGSASMSWRTIVGGANGKMGVGTDGATLAMEVSFPLTSCSQTERDDRTLGEIQLRLKRSCLIHVVSQQQRCCSGANSLCAQYV